MCQSSASPPTSQRMLLKMLTSSAVPPNPSAATLAGSGLAQAGIACAPPRSLGRMSRGSALTPSSASQVLPLESVISGPPQLIRSGTSNCPQAVEVAIKPQLNNKANKQRECRRCMPDSLTLYVESFNSRTSFDSGTGWMTQRTNFICASISTRKRRPKTQHCNLVKLRL